MKTKKAKATGHIQSLDIDISTPIQMKANVGNGTRINILVGENASGKTLVLKLNWVMATIMGICVTGRDVEDFDLTDAAQTVLNHTFVNNDFTGTIKAQFENGSLELQLLLGQIEQISPDLGEAEIATPSIFMSTTMRLFSQVKQYLQVEKLVEGDIDKMGEMYRLYDMQYIELLRARVGHGYELSQRYRDALKDFELDRYGFTSMSLRADGMYATKGDGEEIDLATLSNGEQAMLNMLLVGDLQ